MPFTLPPFRLSFQGKVLIPVIVLLILLPALNVLLVQRVSEAQLRRLATEKLYTADAVFRSKLDERGRSLLFRCRNIIADPRFKAVALNGDGPTISNQLIERIDEFGGDADLMYFSTPAQLVIGSARREKSASIEEFSSSTRETLGRVLAGQSEVRIQAVGHHVYHVISAPLVVSDALIGALVMGVRIGDAVVKESTALTHDEVVLFANGEVAGATLGGGGWRSDLLQYGELPSRDEGAREVVVHNAHYLARAQRFSTEDRSAGYVILSSYEQSFQHLEETRTWLWLLCVAGVLGSTVVIWFAIGRITDPIRQLRNMVEAVGRGDFSQRVRVDSADEVAQLAHAFNQMTRNLQVSREELQKTLQTLKNTQAQLVQSEKLSAVGEFVAGIAHELNNPLTSVIGFAELLKQAKLEPKHQSFVSYIVKSSERCHKIVQGLLSFARQHPPERKLLNVNEVVSTVVELLAYEMRTSNIAVELDLQPNLPPVMGDAHQLQQVFLNMVNNARQAIEAHQPSGRIRIRTEANARDIRVSFQDSGPGIAPENLSKIFDPFFTTKPVGKGTGLGLSLCYGIIKEHAGAIKAESEPGHGATFVIDLPISARTGHTTEFSKATPAGDTNEGAGKRVLVIDDEEWILELVTQILRRDGFEVDTAKDGTAALDQVSRSKYELLVCDWKMPGLSGPQLYERLSELSPETARRVIFMTGDVVSDRFQDFLQKHEKTCLSKPFSVQDFRHAIQGFFAHN